jgi:co-chaperonin GroES (HSP10)
MTLPSNVYPGLNKVLVEEKELPATSVLITGASMYSYGTIGAVGAIKDRETISDTMFNVGDDVYYLSQAGVYIDLPEGKFKLLNVTDILVGKGKN